MEGKWSKKYEYDEILNHTIVDQHPMYHLAKKLLFLHIHQDSELKVEKKLQKAAKALTQRFSLDPRRRNLKTCLCLLKAKYI